ncbi:MAG TPA: alpha-amylase family glycosyl hydrolase [Pengzhenrongella sp.]
MEHDGKPWWQTAVVYQIYPRSFADSNGDGLGDLPGITERLDYVKDLGVDAIWLSPIFRSPMIDFGCDISDHTDIDPRFGTLADAEDLIDAAHRRGIATTCRASRRANRTGPACTTTCAPFER